MKRVVSLFGLLAVAVMVGISVLPAECFAQSARFRDFPTTEPKPGDMAPDFTLKTRDGNTFTLSEAFAERPVVIQFGSYT